MILGSGDVFTEFSSSTKQALVSGYPVSGGLRTGVSLPQTQSTRRTAETLTICRSPLYFTTTDKVCSLVFKQIIFVLHFLFATPNIVQCNGRKIVVPLIIEQTKGLLRLLIKGYEKNLT